MIFFFIFGLLSVSSGILIFDKPVPPFTLRELTRQLRKGVLYTVKDSRGNLFDLKVFASREREMETSTNEITMEARDLQQFSMEKKILMDAAKKSCKDDEGRLKCSNNHIVTSFAIDTPEILYPNGTSVPLSSPVFVDIPKHSNPSVMRKLKVFFGSNVLLRHMAGGRLSDLLPQLPVPTSFTSNNFVEEPSKSYLSFMGSNKDMLMVPNTKISEGRIPTMSLLEEARDMSPFSTIISRYELLERLLPQLIHAVRFTHLSLKVIHLGVTPKSIMCSDHWCSDMQLAEFTNAWQPFSNNLAVNIINEVKKASGHNTISTRANKIGNLDSFVSALFQNKPPVHATEILQDSVRLSSEFSPHNSNKSIKQFLEPAKTFEEAETIDWFSVGGSFFTILMGSRPIIDDDPERVLDLAAGIIKMPGNNRHIRGIGKKSFSFDNIKPGMHNTLLLIESLLQPDRKKRLNPDQLASDVVHEVTVGRR